MHTNHFIQDNNARGAANKPSVKQSRYILTKWSKDIYSRYGDIDSDYVDKDGYREYGYFSSHYRYGGLSKDGIRESLLYCLIDTKLNQVVGYFGISCSDMHIPKSGKNRSTNAFVRFVYGTKALDDFKRGRRAFGAISLDYFAVSNAYRGKVMLTNKNSGEQFKYSDYLMYRCIGICKKISSNIGANVIVLHSTHDGVHTYYKRGFEFIYEDDYELFASKYNRNGQYDKQCVSSDFTYITSRSTTEDNCVPMVLRI